MSAENFEKFRQAVLQDLALQSKLREITERDLFIPHLVEIGAARGFYFEAHTVETAIQASRQVWIERWI